MVESSVDQISISRFKATCLAVIEQVRSSGQPIVVTRRGVPVATIGPPPLQKPAGSAFGCMAGTAEEIEDILEPINYEWDAQK